MAQAFIQANTTYCNTSTRPNAGVDVPTNIAITSANTGSGYGSFSLVSSNPFAVMVQTAGTYEISISISAENVVSGDDEVSVWARINNVPVARSAVRATVPHAHVVDIYNTFTLNMTTSQVLSFQWKSLTGASQLSYLLGSSTVADVPSIQIVLKQLTPSWRPTNTWYVSKHTSTNRLQDGGFNSPFGTVQEAINAANAVSNASGPQIIRIAPGTYSETLTITKGYIAFAGDAPTQFANNVVSIVALAGQSHTINITSATNDNLHLNQVAFSNLTLAASGSTTPDIPTLVDTSTRRHGVIFNQCQLIGRMCAFRNACTAADMRVYMNDCEIAQAVDGSVTLPLIDHRCGALTLYKTAFSNLGNSPCLRVAEKGVLWLASLCGFSNANASADLQPLVYLDSEIVYPQQISLCQFTYSNATAKTAGPSAGVALGTNPQQLVLTNSFFTLLGMPADGDAVHIDGSTTTHQVYARDNYAFNTIASPPAHYINAPVVSMLPLQSA